MYRCQKGEYLYTSGAFDISDTIPSFPASVFIIITARNEILVI